MINRIPMLLISVWLCGFAVFEANAMEQAITREQLIAHIDGMFGKPDHVVMKWGSPVSYDAIALPPFQLEESDWQRLTEVMISLSEASNLPILKQSVEQTGQIPNLLFLFGNNIVELLKTPLAYSLYGLKYGGDELAYRSELEKWAEDTDLDAPYSHKIAFGYSGRHPRFAVSTLNWKNVRESERQKHLYGVAFRLFTGTLSSDFIQPSWANTGRAVDRWEKDALKLYEIDRALIAAIYNDNIAPGDSYTDARSAIIDQVSRAIGMND